MAKITVYSTPYCIWCRRVKQYFDENKIKYKDVDVSMDHISAMEMIEKSGQQGVPVIDIDGKIIVGFDKEAIDKALKIKK